MAFDGGKALQALTGLEDVLNRVAEELAAWRQRARAAERELVTLEAAGDEGPQARELRARLAELEAENAELKERVDAANDRVGELVHRLTFLEQQTLQDAGGRG